VFFTFRFVSWSLNAYDDKLHDIGVMEFYSFNFLVFMCRFYRAA